MGAVAPGRAMIFSGFSLHRGEKLSIAAPTASGAALSSLALEELDASFQVPQSRSAGRESTHHCSASGWRRDDFLHDLGHDLARQRFSISEVHSIPTSCSQSPGGRCPSLTFQSSWLLLPSASLLPREGARGRGACLHTSLRSLQGLGCSCCAELPLPGTLQLFFSLLL